MSHSSGSFTDAFRQPKAVWAVAFACVISFMGIGLVDPILPSLSSQLDASPSQVTLLFTSYLVVTAVAMLVTGWVSSRIGAKRTLIAGLVLIVVFAALAGFLAGIRSALKRIDTGDYGICVDCGDDIAEMRLKAQPTALHCIDCRMDLEARGAA